MVRFQQVISCRPFQNSFQAKLPDTDTAVVVQLCFTNQLIDFISILIVTTICSNLS